MGTTNNPKDSEKKRGWLRNGNPPCDLSALPRCQATARSTGKRCGNPAMKGKRVCRLHGGKAGAPKGNMNALKHGEFTKEAKAHRKELATLLRMIRQSIGE